MYSPRSLICALLVLCLFLDITSADRHAILRRDDSLSSTTAPASTNKPFATASVSDNGDNKSTTKTDTSARASGTAEVSSKNSTSSSTTSSMASTTSVPATTVTGNLNGPAYTGVFYNATLSPDELPLQPEVSPAFAVGGVILMGSGIVYTLIGIKNKMLHVCLSTGYLASLSVTVLIIYLLSPPVSHAIEGAYLVAITMTGLILGAAAVVFKEMTEGLGALLGGFCFSMWLLVLAPGGLLKSTGPIAAFIACFTVVAFATTFSHYTRPYGLIGGISFGGATVTVLGIDCFSKAGLKEFWAYIWNLNGNIFPLGANTYPITRGIKVEIAAIFILFLAGLVSQMKLWTIIKEKREQRAAHRLENEKNLEAEEAGVGQRVENETARDRGEWEAVYGDKDVKDAQASSSNGKKGASSTTTAVASDEGEIEMIDSPQHTNMAGAGLVMRNQQPSSIMVRVIEEDIHEDATSVEIRDAMEDSEAPAITTTPAADPETESKGVWIASSDAEARPASVYSSRTKPKRKSAQLQIVPLPFSLTNDDTRSNRSSVATFNDDEMDKRISKRISGGSAILRSLSRQSRLSSHRASRGSLSQEHLVDSHSIMDNRSSVAATMDEMTDDEGDRDFEEPYDLTRSISNRSSVNFGSNTAPTSPMSPTFLMPPPFAESRSKRSSTASVKSVKEEPQASSLTPSTHRKEADISNKISTVADKSDSKSAAEAKAVPAPLTKDALPAAMSKVVMKYRTNEWAKHLSLADSPALDELTVAKPVEEKSEVAAPVNVVELQQTAENATVAPARRTISESSAAKAQKTSRDSYDPYKPAESRSSPAPEQVQPSSSQTSLGPPQPHSQPHLLRNSSSLTIGPTLVESPIEDWDASTAVLPEPTNVSEDNSAAQTAVHTLPSFAQIKPNTLLGQRDSYLRNKSALGYSPTPLSATQEDLLQSSYAPSGSSYSQQGDPRLNDDDMTLSSRRSIIRQSSNGSQQGIYLQQQQTGSYQMLDSAGGPPQAQYNSRNSSQMSLSQQQQQYQSQTSLLNADNNYSNYSPTTQRNSHIHPLMRRESQLSAFRDSVARDLQANSGTQAEVERSRIAMSNEQKVVEARKREQQRVQKEKERSRDRGLRMNRGGVLSAHQEAMIRMQKGASVDGRGPGRGTG